MSLPFLGEDKLQGFRLQEWFGPFITIWLELSEDRIADVWAARLVENESFDAAGRLVYYSQSVGSLFRFLVPLR